MDIFNEMQTRGHEQVLFSHDPSCGYLGIIAIHDTTLGPALGGTRVWPYQSTEEALQDVLRLSRGMTYKSAVAGLNLGGGKAVIIADPKRPDRESLFRAHGRFVETLGGRYITAEDVGTSPIDMEFVRRETKHVAGLLNLSGDPSPVTGYGVYVGMKACAKQRWGKDSLAGKTVAVQGAGKVAYYLMKHLKDEGAKLIATDIDQEKVKRVVEELGAQAVAPDAIYDAKADIFAPCALGAIINDDTIKRLGVEIVAGGANNQLAEAAARRRTRAEGDSLRPRLRDQWRRRRERVRRAAGLDHGARQAQGAGDLRHHPARLRDCRHATRFHRSRPPIGWPRSASARWRRSSGCGSRGTGRSAAR